MTSSVAVYVTREFEERGVMIHFLHIGKTGGTAFHNAVVASGERVKFHLHGHQVTLVDVPQGEKVIFFLRHPVSRFVSAFYSRFRQGQPMTFRPWKPAEEKAFTRFVTANALAEALSSDDEDEKIAAEGAMRGIGHVKSSFYDWMSSDAYFSERKEDLLFVGFQETLDADMVWMQQKAIIPASIVLPTDEVKAHKTPASFDQKLSDLAVNNIKAWYASDIAFYQDCLMWRREKWPDAPLL